MVDYPLHIAAMNGEATKVSQLLAEKPELATVKDDDSRYALHWAVSFQHDNIVDILLSYMKKVDLDTVLDDSGWSPLHIASSVGSMAIIEKLLAHSITPSLDLQSKNGLTALYLACSKCHMSVVQLLIAKGASVRIKDNNGQLALHRAAAAGSAGIVSILCDAKSPVNTRDRNGWPPVFHALAEGNGDMAVLLVNKYNAEWNEEGGDNQPKIDQIYADQKVKEYFLSHVSSH